MQAKVIKRIHVDNACIYVTDKFNNQIKIHLRKSAEKLTDGYILKTIKNELSTFRKFKGRNPEKVYDFYRIRYTKSTNN